MPLTVIYKIILIFAALLAYSCSSDNESEGYGGKNSNRYGSFIDARDSVEYRTIKIGDQVWMADNLNYYTTNSNCYGNKESCDKYGRTYDWATAMALDASCNSSVCGNRIQSKHGGICPAGWHIPSNAEWSSNSDESFFKIDFGILWWGADEHSDRYGYLWNMAVEGEQMRGYRNNKIYSLGVRCIRN
jgi:hypothetical protein